MEENWRSVDDVLPDYYLVVNVKLANDEVTLASVVTDGVDVVWNEYNTDRVFKLEEVKYWVNI